MNTIEMKKRVLWHLLMAISTAHSTAIKHNNPFETIRIHDHAELSGQFAMAYYVDAIPEIVKTNHTYAVYASIEEYEAMYADILSLYLECGGHKEFAPTL